MLVKAIKCPKCKDIVYSRARHDMRFCSCQEVSIDGGFDYNKISWVSGEPPQVFDLEVDTNERMLYDDWNFGLDKFGREKGK